MFSAEWQITWMASETRLPLVALRDPDCSGQNYTCTPLLSWGWQGSKFTHIRGSGLLWGCFSAPVSTSGKRNLTAGAAEQWMGSDSLWILVTEVVLVHGCGGRFSCELWAWLCVLSSLWSLGCAVPQAGRCWLSCCSSVLPRRLLLHPGWCESEIKVQLCDC